MNNNYFAVGTRHFFFNDRDAVSTTRAFDRARATGPYVTMFLVPRRPGPWDKLAVVGHRQRSIIIHDLHVTQDDTKRYFLREELFHLEQAYVRSGRQTLDEAAA